MLRNAKFIHTWLRIRPQTVIHIGADKGQDRKQYLKMKCKNIIWCEADPTNVAYLSSNFPADRVIQGVIWDQDLESLDFYSFQKTSLSSAISPLPQIQSSEVKKFSLPARKLDSVIDVDSYIKEIMLVIDVQGAEIQVLNGATTLLKNTKYIVIEINQSSEIYSTIPKESEINTILISYGFKPSISRYSHDDSYRDQLYLKTNNIWSIKILDKIFDFLLKTRHLLLKKHLPKYHYYCQKCSINSI